MKMNEEAIVERVEALKAMHTVMMYSNDERLYYRWICTFPDEPSEGEMRDIAKNPKLFWEVVKEFNDIINSGYEMYLWGMQYAKKEAR